MPGREFPARRGCTGGHRPTPRSRGIAAAVTRAEVTRVVVVLPAGMEVVTTIQAMRKKVGTTLVTARDPKAMAVMVPIMAGMDTTSRAVVARQLNTGCCVADGRYGHRKGYRKSNSDV